MFDLLGIWRWIFGSRPQMTIKDLEDMDVAVEYPLTVYDEEKFETKDGELAATTATISEESITNIPGPQLDGYPSDLSPSHYLLCAKSLLGWCLISILTGMGFSLLPKLQVSLSMSLGIVRIVGLGTSQPLSS